MGFTAPAMAQSTQVATVMGKSVTFGQTIQGAAKATSGITTFIKAMEGIGTAVQVFGQIQAGRTESSIYNYNAQVSQERARLALERGKVETEAQRRRARRFTAQQEASYAAAGVRLVGSPLEVITADAAEMEMDALISDYNARIDAWSASQDAAMSLVKSQVARNAGFIKAGTTLLTSIPRFARS